MVGGKGKDIFRISLQSMGVLLANFCCLPIPQNHSHSSYQLTLKFLMFLVILQKWKFSRNVRFVQKMISTTYSLLTQSPDPDLETWDWLKVSLDLVVFWIWPEYGLDPKLDNWQYINDRIRHKKLLYCLLKSQNNL